MYLWGKMNKTSEILEQLEKPVDVKRLMDKLSFALDNFEQANAEQPRLYLEAGRYCTMAVLRKARAEIRLETTQAEYGVRLRQKKQELGSKSITDKAVQSVIDSSEEIIQLKTKSAMSKSMEVWAKQLVEAYNHRLQVLNNITKIRSAETSSNIRTAKEEAEVKQIRQKAREVRRRLEEEDET